MGQGYKMLGFVVIAILYVVIGVMAAKGTICIFRKILTPKSEQILYGVFLILVATIYVAFVAYFGAATAWQLETTAVVAFAVIGLLGAPPVGDGFCSSSVGDSSLKCRTVCRKGSRANSEDFSSRKTAGSRGPTLSYCRRSSRQCHLWSIRAVTALLATARSRMRFTEDAAMMARAVSRKNDWRPVSNPHRISSAGLRWGGNATVHSSSCRSSSHESHELGERHENPFLPRKTGHLLTRRFQQLDLLPSRRQR
jgi:hypothetical protein